MKLTNRKNLPDIIARAVANDPYDPGETTDYSVTTLLKPAHQVMLERQHQDEITEDVADRLWAMYGSAIHYIIERAENENDLIEERFYAEIDGKVISAQIDHYGLDTCAITDWKLTSAYKVKKALAGGDHDWEAQLNVQRHLMLLRGYRVDSLHIGAMVRDWSAWSWKTEEGYPDQIEYIEIPMWPDEKTVQYIKNRIVAMENPELCTREERWQPEPDYAVIKKGGSRPAKVESTFDAAATYAANKGWGGLDADGKFLSTDYEIIEREGPNRRCEGYCSVAPFCEFYKANYMAAEDLPFK